MLIFGHTVSKMSFHSGRCGAQGELQLKAGLCQGSCPGAGALCDLCVWQDSVMPSQEPRLDDKNDEADLPSEDTDGSEYFAIPLALIFSFSCLKKWKNMVNCPVIFKANWP